MLRDKLTSVGSDLVDSRNRVAELESAQILDRAAMQALSHNLADAGRGDKVLDSAFSPHLHIGQQLSELSVSMKKQQHELYDVLSIAAETDAKLCAANERYVR